MTDGAFWFDEEAAARAEAFFPEALVHSKGKWRGQPFELQPWQSQVVRDVFGWKHADGTRRYRTVFIEIPRKNGKSTFCAGLALYLLAADGEPGAEVYSAAADKDQAAIVFDVAKEMVEASPQLLERIQVFRRSMTYRKLGASYKVLSADANTKHGQNAHGIVFDELHTQKTRDLWDTLTTGTGARAQPLTIVITTAGHDFTSICREQYEYAKAVRDGVIVDESYYPVIFETEEEEDWQDEALWAKANPGLGINLSIEYLRAEARKARHSLAYQNTFRRLHLNQWTRQRDRFIDLEAWDACAEPVNLDALYGQSCYGGLDLANTSDLNAFVRVFGPDEDGVFDIVPTFWIPEANVERRVREGRVPYDAWVRAGFIQTTPGNIADHRQIQRDIVELRAHGEIREIAFDRWGSVQVSTGLQDEGLTMVQFGQGFASMSPPTKDLLRLVSERKIRHGGNPVLRWMVNNLVVKSDEAGNQKPDKARSSEKIDGVVATIMALDRAMRDEAEPEGPSVYEERGILTL